METTGCFVTICFLSRQGLSGLICGFRVFGEVGCYIAHRHSMPEDIFVFTWYSRWLTNRKVDFVCHKLLVEVKTRSGFETKKEKLEEFYLII